ncbi:hypothetical protein C5S31_03960 [ANME-1 cluster archaeon GoMg2]|nr:hypothetical protein [ANME-1 cluster archaeon GoMg2]
MHPISIGCGAAGTSEAGMSASRIWGSGVHQVVERVLCGGSDICTIKTMLYR